MLRYLLRARGVHYATALMKGVPKAVRESCHFVVSCCDKGVGMVLKDSKESFRKDRELVLRAVVSATEIERERVGDTVGFASGRLARLALDSAHQDLKDDATFMKCVAAVNPVAALCCGTTRAMGSAVVVDTIIEQMILRENHDRSDQRTVDVARAIPLHAYGAARLLSAKIHALWSTGHADRNKFRLSIFDVRELVLGASEEDVLAFLRAGELGRVSCITMAGVLGDSALNEKVFSAMDRFTAEGFLRDGGLDAPVDGFAEFATPAAVAALVGVLPEIMHRVQSSIHKRDAGVLWQWLDNYLNVPGHGASTLMSADEFKILNLAAEVLVDGRDSLVRLAASHPAILTTVRGLQLVNLSVLQEVAAQGPSPPNPRWASTGRKTTLSREQQLVRRFMSWTTQFKRATRFLMCDDLAQVPGLVEAVARDPGPLSVVNIDAGSIRSTATSALMMLRVLEGARFDVATHGSHLDTFASATCSMATMVEMHLSGINEVERLKGAAERFVSAIYAPKAVQASHVLSDLPTLGVADLGILNGEPEGGAQEGVVAEEGGSKRQRLE
jgi:hypothetical protein